MKLDNSNDQFNQSYDSLLDTNWDSLNLLRSSTTLTIDSTSSTNEQDRNIRNWMSISNVNNYADRDSRSSYAAASNNAYSSNIGRDDDFELFGGNTEGGSSYYGIDSTLPDLIPDENPFSISNTVTTSTSSGRPTRPNYTRSDRSSSLPPLSSKKLPKRRTLESSHQSSFLTSLYGYDNLNNNGIGEDGRSNSGSSNDSLNDDNNSLFGVVGVGLGNTSSKRGGEYFNSHTDSPLTREEQEDLLDRVRRDLLGVNLDTLRGPLRALALSAVHSSSSPSKDSSPSLLPLPTTINHRNSLALPNLIGEESEFRKTVSPQEAFLDYDSVDQQLQLNHQSKNRSSSSNNFGIGIGASLFAPLPSLRTSTTPKSPAAVPSPLSPRLSSTSTSTSGRRVSHPFSVPKNAVSWTSKPSASPAPVSPLIIATTPAKVSAPAKEEEIIKPFHLGRASTSTSLPVSSPLPASSISSQHVAGKTIRRTSRPPVPRIASEVPEASEESELSDIEEVVPVKPTSALQFPSSSRATNFAPAPVPLPTNSNAAAISTTTTQVQKKRKRSRVIAPSSDAEGDSDNDNDDGEYHSSTSSHSTAPHHHHHSNTGTSSSRGRKPNVASHRSQPQTNKRRRRSSSTLPSSSSTSTSSTTSGNAIACPFILENGQQCNIIFRRPYDLSRHRETIHGEILPGRIGSGLAGGKTVAVAGNGRLVVPGRIDWICFEVSFRFRFRFRCFFF